MMCFFEVAICDLKDGAGGDVDREVLKLKVSISISK